MTDNEPPIIVEGDGPADSTQEATTGLLRGLPGGKRSAPKDTPPRRRTPRVSRTAGTSTPKEARVVDALPDGTIAAGMAEMYGQIGMFWGMFDPQCAAALTANAVEMGKSLEAVAKESPAVRDFLQKMVTTSAWGKVIAAHLPVAMAIAMHHVPAIQKRFNPGVPEHADTGMNGNSKTGNVA